MITNFFFFYFVTKYIQLDQNFNPLCQGTSSELKLFIVSWKYTRLTGIKIISIYTKLYYITYIINIIILKYFIHKYIYQRQEIQGNNIYYAKIPGIHLQDSISPLSFRRKVKAFLSSGLLMCSSLFFK